MRPLYGEPTGDRLPSGKSISNADRMMAKTSRGICLADECMRLADGDDLLCTDHRKEA